MERIKRTAEYEELKEYCNFAKEGDFMEVTEWANGEGFDVLLHSSRFDRISLTFGEWELLKKLVKKLDTA